jgi:predicted Zn-dependent peptidase
MMEKIDNVTAKDLMRVAKDLFVNEKLNLAIVGPYKMRKN